MPKNPIRKKKPTFEQRLEKLAEAYGIKPSEIAISQIIDLDTDLSGETLSNVYALVMKTAEEIKTQYERYGKPNVLIDAKIEQAAKNFETSSFEMAYMFVRTCLSHYKVQIKKPGDTVFKVCEFEVNS